MLMIRSILKLVAMFSETFVFTYNTWHYYPEYHQNFYIYVKLLLFDWRPLAVFRRSYHQRLLLRILNVTSNVVQPLLQRTRTTFTQSFYSIISHAYPLTFMPSWNKGDSNFPLSIKRILTHNVGVKK